MGSKKRKYKIRVEILSFGDNYIEFLFAGALSVNNLYRNRKGRVKPYIQAKSIVYDYIQKRYGNACEHKFLVYDAYRFRYFFIFNSNKRRDVSNYVKFFEDVVFRLFIKDDDSKVQEIHMQKAIGKIGNMNYVRIEWDKYEEKKENKEKIVEHVAQKIKEQNSMES